MLPVKRQKEVRDNERVEFSISLGGSRKHLHLFKPSVCLVGESFCRQQSNVFSLKRERTHAQASSTSSSKVLILRWKVWLRPWPQPVTIWVVCQPGCDKQEACFIFQFDKRYDWNECRASQQRTRQFFSGFQSTISEKVFAWLLLRCFMKWSRGDVKSRPA